MSAFLQKIVKRQKEKKNELEKFPMTKIVVKLVNFCACKGCWLKVDKILTKTKGIETKSIDKQKCLITVTGTIDTEVMKDKLVKMRKDHKVEIVYKVDIVYKDDGGKVEKEEVANTTNSSTEKPSEKVDTKSSSKEKAEEKIEGASSSEEKPNEVEGGPSSGQTGGAEGGDGYKPMSEYRLEYGPPTGYVYGGFDYAKESNYGPNYAYGNGPCNYAQGYTYGSGLDHGGRSHAAPDASECSIM